MRIIQHWFGPMPEMIQFARWTVREIEHNVVDVFDKPEDHDAIRLTNKTGGELYPAQYLADVIRARELRENGGLWLDSDYVALRKSSEIKTHLLANWLGNSAMEAMVFADTYKGPREYENDFLAIKAGTLWAEEYYQRIMKRCRTGKALQWGDLGRRVLNEMMTGESVWDLAVRRSAVVVFPDEVSLYRGMTNAWDQESPHEFLPVPDGGVGLQLCHSLSGKYLQEKTVAEWRETPTVIGSVIRLAEKNIGKRFQVDRVKL